MNYDFLITTANSAYFNEKEKLDLLLLLNKLIVDLDSTGYTYALRIFDDELVKSLKISKNIDNLTNGNFLEAGKVIKKGIFSTRSSLFFEAMSMNLSVCELIYRNVPIFSSPGWVLHVGTSGVDVLASMYKPEIERLIYQKQILNDYLNLDVDSIDKEIKIIENKVSYIRVLPIKVKTLIKYFFRTKRDDENT